MSDTINQIKEWEAKAEKYENIKGLEEKFLKLKEIYSNFESEMQKLLSLSYTLSSTKKNYTHTKYNEKVELLVNQLRESRQEIWLGDWEKQNDIVQGSTQTKFRILVRNNLNLKCEIPYGYGKKLKVSYKENVVRPNINLQEKINHETREFGIIEEQKLSEDDKERARMKIREAKEIYH